MDKDSVDEQLTFNVDGPIMSTVSKLIPKTDQDWKGQANSTTTSLPNNQAAKYYHSIGWSYGQIAAELHISKARVGAILTGVKYVKKSMDTGVKGRYEGNRLKATDYKPRTGNGRVYEWQEFTTLKLDELAIGCDVTVRHMSGVLNYARRPSMDMLKVLRTLAPRLYGELHKHWMDEGEKEVRIKSPPGPGGKSRKQK